MIKRGMTERAKNMFRIQLALILCWTTLNCVLGDLPPGTKRNTYLPPESTTGYNYNTPSVPFPPRPPPTPVTPTSGRPRPTPRPTPGPRPTPTFPDYPGVPSSNNGNKLPPDHPDHVHEPGMPFDFNYAVKEDAFGNDYSHNAISDGDVTRGEYRVQLPDGRTQVVRYTADWKHGFSAQVSYEGTPRLDLQRPPGPGGNFRGY